ncbi:hypothetical protein NM208_g12690 [Fusarium decemcellulare]|uniref:Uncharacterized protein n=1 Tax=Fusarium decemcellulare TaxID=57161 RepID=A0ACC1RNW6_9HYPO|nr:hypothetical protein NM208_g12690 [Fusarium decemcellulare]
MPKYNCQTHNDEGTGCSHDAEKTAWVDIVADQTEASPGHRTFMQLNPGEAKVLKNEPQLYDSFPDAEKGDVQDRPSMTVLDRVLSRTIVNGNNDPGPPPDGVAWAWAAAIAGHLVMMNTCSFGLFQAYYTKALDDPASKISWIGSVQVSVLFFVGTLAGLVRLVTLGLANLLLRPRVSAKRSGSVVDVASFKEKPYALFSAGMFFAFWGIYFAYYYLAAFATTQLDTPSPRPTLSIFFSSSTVSALLAVRSQT